MMSDERPPPTEEQARALGVEGSSVALSAGAGCGKTFVLAERFVRALDGPDARPLSRIVALTFTNKAARELRERIRRECRARLDSGLNPLRWRAVLRGLPAARIGTFHSFCGEVLRRYAVEAGIDPGFTVLDESIAMAIREESLDLTLRERLSVRDPDLMDLAVEYGLGMVRDSIDELLGNRSVGDLGAWADREPKMLVDGWRDGWVREVQPALVAGFVEKARPCLELIDSTTFDDPKIRGRLDELRQSMRLLPARPNPIHALDEINESAKVQGLGAKDWPSPEVYESVKSHFEVIRKESSKLKKSLSWDEPTSLIAALQGLKFARLTLKARVTYDRLKQARGGIDNDDLLVKTRDLLSGDSAVREALSSSIDLVLVDEFQDTDPIQSEILNSLAGSRLPDGKLFLVGDFKQSIYRFRGAMPELFQHYREQFPRAGQLALSENFRSIPAVLDFVNALFAETFTDPDSALRAGIPPPGHEKAPAIEFLWGTTEIDSPGEQPDVNARRKDEARRLARHLKSKLDQCWMIRDPNGKGYRQATRGDVAFLFRSLSDASSYEQALVAEGLDYHIVGGSGFFAQQEVLDLINVLTAVEDPLDGVSLAGALRSPFFSISDDALYWISTDRIGMPHLGLSRTDSELLDKLSEADRARASRARHLLSRWRSIKDEVSIACLVDRILTESGYEAALIGEFLGDRKRANARKLVRMARRFDEQGGFTLADFVARLRADLRSATKETQAATTDEQGEIIRLMSIHQAKGLEFPIVVLPDLDRGRPGEMKRVAFDSRLGPVVNPVAELSEGDGEDEPEGGPSLGWVLYRYYEKLADDAESLRLFYVATTRARDALVLSSATDPEKKPKSPALKLLDQRFDRLTGRLNSLLPEGWPVPGVCVVPGTKPSSHPRATSRHRPRLHEVAGIIREASSHPVDPAPIPVTRPRVVVLDSVYGLPSTSARLDRLIRTILADPRSLEPGRLSSIAARCARVQNPVASANLLSRAVERVANWAKMSLAREIAKSEVIWRSSTWTIFWPEDGDSTLFQGQADLVYRRADGQLCLVNLSDPEASEPREWLRLLLSARAVEKQGGGSISQAWWVRLGDTGGSVGTERFDDSQVDRAVRSLLAVSPQSISGP